MISSGLVVCKFIIVIRLELSRMLSDEDTSVKIFFAVKHWLCEV